MLASLAVLVIDEDSAVGDQVTESLTTMVDSVECDVVAGPDQAAELIASGRYDCIVVDYGPAYGDGVDLLENVRLIDPTIPVIIFTSQGDEETASRMIEAGATRYLPKGTEDQFERLATNILSTVEEYRHRQELEASQQQLHNLYERVSDGLFIVDDAWRYTYVNQTGASMVAYTPDEMIGQTVWSVFPELEGTGFEAVLRTAMDDGEPASIESYFDPLDAWFNVSVYPSSSGISIYFQDVTDRKNRVMTLSRLNETAGELFQETNVERACSHIVEVIDDVLGHPVNGVWLRTDDGDGLEPIAVTGHELVETDPPRFDRDQSLAWDVFERGSSEIFSNLATEREVHNPETVLGSEMIVPIDSHGVIIVSSTESNAFDDEDLQVVELVAYHLEVTIDRIHHEARLEAAFDTVPEPVVHVIFEDDTPIIHHANQAFEEVFGLASDEAIGMAIDEFIVPSGEESDAIDINRAIVDEERYEAEILRETPAGQRPFLFTAKTMPSADGSEDRTEAIATYVDLSEQIERERELKRQNDRLQRFADVLSHDIPNHLAVAAGHIELAEETGDTSFLERVEAAHTRIETLVNDMKTLVRTGSPIDTIEPVQLEAIARSCWNSCCSEEDLQSIEVVDEIRIMADRTRITQLLENLFWNACDHAGDDVVVRVGSLDGGFFVEDDGPGIPTGERDSVFDAGYTTSSDGTGFGLAIVREIAGAHGWDIELTAGTDGGARFEFTGVESPE